MIENITAVYNHPEAGYGPATLLEIGKSYKVLAVHMGAAYTLIMLEGFERGFNSVQFDFFENGNPLDIYADSRFNPYLRSKKTDRKKTYTNALVRYGDRHQMDIAIEEMAECTQAICKIKRGGENFSNLAEEVADVLICMEQLRMMFNIDEMVEYWMDYKIARLEENLKR